MQDKTISVIGLGYIGLPTAAVVAGRGFQVIGVDVNQHAVDTINKGDIHIIEPDLDVVVRSVVTTGNLRATTIPEPADIFLIAVPTPFKENNAPDLAYVESATRNIASVLKKGDMVILESTSPVGTTEKIAGWLAEERSDLRFPSDKNSTDIDVNLAHCPERVLPGHVLRELIENDRVIGGITEQCSERATAFYKSFVQGDCIKTDARTAEMAKLTENTFRDVNIAFANELSLICDKMNIDVWELIALANRHPRVNILQPGPGVGGHCLAVDPWFIVDSAPEQAKMTRLSRNINDGKPHFVINKVKALAEQVSEPVVACFGAAFKPDIDDLRESPALSIIETLAKELNHKVLVVEPHIQELPKSLQGMDNVQLVSLEDALSLANTGVLLVAHKDFKEAGAAAFEKLNMMFAVQI
ncbi:UDP-N-acetyl-D-mannosamine dehydrogenase [Pleionea sp. CnH1-48]|uniref:UDP-N-acetyl-D-mannosamine dehydrogenase n=1 Tax=Pleionea sp. CnH1-48 TaxID=2954494 RepID=UPI0020980B94|nr:UDP-N-acetyl-D-mannosamine dehydrogenase [Pleionea sp. CnH1-48]MCO7223816.1 UDP-N-acetyl-D-mannosamine dehydrogenase [Pleionea sp. CnH1-48]